MNQVEIAKKILEQGSCGGIKCYDDNCPFTDIYDTTDKQKWIEKIKQWLKEQEKKMIDLTVNQIVDPPVKCWVRDCDEETYDEDLLFSVDHRKTKRAFATENGMFKQCTLTDPTVSTKKIKKWLTVEDVPVELWGRALVKRKDAAAYSSYIMTPVNTFGATGKLLNDMHYLPLGQPLTGKWLPFESEE